jgi:hypothetical protein
MASAPWASNQSASPTVVAEERMTAPPTPHSFEQLGRGEAKMEAHPKAQRIAAYLVQGVKVAILQSSDVAGVWRLQAGVLDSRLVREDSRYCFYLLPSTMVRATTYPPTLGSTSSLGAGSKPGRTSSAA